MKNVVTFEVVMERLKQAFELSSDKDLAEFLNLKPNAFYNRKRSGSIPFDEIIEVAQQHKMCVDWLLFGRGSPFLDQKESSLPPLAAVDGTLMGEIMAELERAFLGDLASEHLAGIRFASVKGTLAAHIYNEVLYTKSAKNRAAAIADKAKGFGAASLAQAYEKP